MAKDSKTIKIHTPEGRVSFPKVFTKSEYSGKYEVTLVFPDGTDLSRLVAAAKEAAKAKWGDKIPSGLRNPFRKTGEKPELYGEDFGLNSIFIGFRSQNRQPGVVDAQLQPILDANEFYPGCWARVSCNAYAYDTKGNKGIAFGLINVQKIRDDEPLAASAVKAEDDFEALAGITEAEKAGANDDIFGSSGGPVTGSNDFLF